MRKLLQGALLALVASLCVLPARAQDVHNFWQCALTGFTQWCPVSTTNPLPVTASVSASITGFPGAAPTTGTPISVTTGGVTGTLPAGAVVVGFNVGTTNTAYCKLGASSTTSDTAIQPGSWFAFTVASATQLTCITSTSTTTVNMVGGSGLPTGSGGGGGGSSLTNYALETGGNLATVVTNTTGILPNTSTTGVTTAPIGCRTLTAAPTDTTATVNMPRCMLDGSFAVSTVPNPNTGLTTYFVQPAASDNHANIKNGAGQVYWIGVFNNSSTVNYLRLYNAATGFNGCNSATNLVAQFQIPASTTVGGVSIPLPYGLTFSTGISVCVTSGYATNDTTNATATAMSVNIGYN